MTRRAYVPNPAAAEQLKRQGEYRDGMGKISKNLAASIELESPIETGAFQDSIKTFDAGDPLLRSVSPVVGRMTL